MARLPCLCLPGIPQHIIRRGKNRQICFASSEDFSAYSYWLEKYSNKYQVKSIHGSLWQTMFTCLFPRQPLMVYPAWYDHQAGNMFDISITPTNNDMGSCLAFHMCLLIFFHCPADS